MVNTNTKKGFTLIELLAAITILAVILVITVPSVSNIIKSSTKKAFVLDVQKVIQRIEAQQIRDITFDETNINASNMEEMLDISDNNYEALYVSSLPDETKDSGKGEIYVYAVGKNKWKDLVVQGTYSSINVSKKDDCKDTEMFTGYANATIDEDEYIAVGMEGRDFTEYSDGGNAIIVKHSSDGNIIWRKAFSGSGADAFSKIITVSDGYIAVGAFSSANGDMTGLNKGGRDAIIVKHDKFGNVLWKKTFGGTLDDYFYSIVEVSDGYIAVGDSYSNDIDLAGLNKGYSDAIIVKYDFNGNVLWKKVFGGSSQETFNDVVKTSDGYIVVGESYSSDGDMENFDKGYYNDAIIVKYDTSGNVLWKSVFGGNSSDSFDAVANTSDGYVVVGESVSSDVDLAGLNKGNSDVIIVKYDSSGNILWSRTFGGTGEDRSTNITPTIDGFIITGSSDSDDIDLAGVSSSNYERGLLFKIGTDGTTKWKKIMENTLFSMLSGVVSDENSLITTGFSYDATVKPILGKYDENGDVIWENNDAQIVNVCEEYDDCMLEYIQTHDIIQSGITSNSTGYVTVGSEFGSDMEIIPWLTKYDENGKILWDKKVALGAIVPLFIDVKMLDDDYFAVIYSLYGNPSIARFNSDGNKVWEKVSFSEEMYVRLTVTSTGIIVTGMNQNDSSFIRCFDLNGEIVWTKNLEESESLVSIINTDDGYLSTGASGSNGLTIKYDLNGNIVWKKAYDIGMEEILTSATVSDNGYVVVGYSQDDDYVAAGIIIKYDFEGNILWEDQLGNDSTIVDVASASDGYIAVGYNNSNKPLIIKYNENGTKNWEKNYNGFTGGFKNVIIRNNSIIVLGGSEDFELGILIGVSSPVVVSYDLNGNYKWHESYKEDQMELICP